MTHWDTTGETPLSLDPFLTPSFTIETQGLQKEWTEVTAARSNKAKHVMKPRAMFQVPAPHYLSV